MLKISIVPDTNVLVSNLELVKYIYASGMSIPYTVNISRTVLEELDGLKRRSVGARNAIRFIESVSDSMRTEIEGRLDDRKVDVMVEPRDPVHERNSDDKILNYCLRLENPVFLTNDRAFYLKCMSSNIVAVAVEGKVPESVVCEIERAIGLDSDKVREASMAQIGRLKNAVQSAIEPVIFGILSRELGIGRELVLKENSTLENLLDVVRNNFFLFKDFLPQKSPKIIAEFQESLSTSDLKKSRELARLVCAFFRRVLPNDSF